VGPLEEIYESNQTVRRAWRTPELGAPSSCSSPGEATPQTVNDWLNGRDKMTGEQALRVQELLQKENRKRPSRTSLKPTGELHCNAQVTLMRVELGYLGSRVSSDGCADRQNTS